MLIHNGLCRLMQPRRKKPGRIKDYLGQPLFDWRYVLVLNFLAQEIIQNGKGEYLDSGVKEKCLSIWMNYSVPTDCSIMLLMFRISGKREWVDGCRHGRIVIVYSEDNPNHARIFRGIPLDDEKFKRLSG